MAIPAFNTASFSTAADLATFVQTDTNVNVVIQIVYPSDGSGLWWLFYI